MSASILSKYCGRIICVGVAVTIAIQMAQPLAQQPQRPRMPIALAR